jgi:hypothetical protein
MFIPDNARLLFETRSLFRALNFLFEIWSIFHISVLMLLFETWSLFAVSVPLGWAHTYLAKLL